MLIRRNLLWVFAASPLVFESGCKGFGSCEWRKSTYVTDAHGETGDMDWAEVSFKSDRAAVNNGLLLQAAKGQITGLAVYDFHFISEVGDYEFSPDDANLIVTDQDKSRFVPGYRLNSWGESLLRKISEGSGSGRIVVNLRKSRLGTETAQPDKAKVSLYLDKKRAESIVGYVRMLAPDSAVSVLAVDIEPMTMPLMAAKDIYNKHVLNATGGLSSNSGFNVNDISSNPQSSISISPNSNKGSTNSSQSSPATSGNNNDGFSSVGNNQ